MKAFERICEVLYIVPTIGLFFSFFEVKGVDNRSWVQVSGIPTRSFLQVYSSNYKNYKDRFVRVRGGSSCPQVLYASDGHPRFPHYWTKNPLSITGFNYDKLSSSELSSLAILDSFRMMRVKELLPLSDEELLTYLGNCYFCAMLLYLFVCADSSSLCR